MSVKLGYDYVMRRLALLSLASAAFLIAASGAPSANAQSVNWGPSVTSLGFGGSNHLGAVPPSVTSLGFAHTGNFHGDGHSRFFTPAVPERSNFESRHHRPYIPVWGGYYAYPVLDYGYDYSAIPDSPENAENPDEYRGGPTIFDRRGDGQYPPPGTTHYAEPAHESQDAKDSSAPPPAAEVAAQPQTVLVFKDGHQAKVDNYAIVGSTLYDLTGGQRHKIALADLDLTATAQQNDDRGVDFELPTSLSN